MIRTLVFFILISCTNIHADEKFDFCSRTLSEHREHINQIENRIAFENNGGIFNGGVCWWHSRLQRASEYLVVFKPELPKPTRMIAKKIINSIIRHTQVVEIPGYSSFFDFTKDFQDLIQNNLNEWQLEDAVIRLAWIKGLKGRTSTSPENLKIIMDKAYDIVELQSQILFTKLQIKGITSHAWLITHMKKNVLGYSLEIIDSNWPDRTNIYEYKFGDTSFYVPEYENFVPYIDYQEEVKDILKAKSIYCQPLQANDQIQ